MLETTPATILATLAFAGLWFYTRRPEKLSFVIFMGLLVDVVGVALLFSIKFQNIVIVKDIFAQVACCGLFFLWLSHLFRKDIYSLSPDPLKNPVFIFFAVSLLSAFLAPRWSWYYSLEEIVRDASGILMYFMAVRFLNTESRWKTGLHTIQACMVITSVYAILQVRGFDFMNWGFIVNVSTFGNKDFFASFLTYIFPVTLFMAIGAKNIFDGVLYLVMSALALYNIVQGETRGAWVGLMALAAVTVLFECRFGRLRAWLGSFKKIALFWAAALLVIAALIPFAPKHQKETFQSIFQTHRGTNIIRVYIWWGSLRMWWDNPVFGQGIGSYQLTYPSFRPDRYHRIGMSHNTRHAHSEELELLAEQGILGFSAGLAVVLIFFYLGWRQVGRMEDLSRRYLFFGILASVFTGLVHDSLNVNLRWTSSAVAFWFMLALGSRYLIGFDPPPEKKPGRNPSCPAEPPSPAWTAREIFLGALLTAAFAFMFCLEWKTFRADYFLKRVEGSVERPAARDNGIETARRLLREMPYDHSAYYKAAYGYLQEDKIEEANKLYLELFNLAPNYTQLHQNTALIAYRKFMTTSKPRYLYQAILEFEWATGLENNFENHFKMIQIYVQYRNDTSRCRYHNHYLFRNVREDSFFNIWRYYIDVWNQPNMSPSLRQSLNDVYLKPIDEMAKTHWLFKTDMVRRAGRPADEIRYAMKMATRFQPDHRELMGFAVSTLLVSTTPSAADRNLMYLLSIVENLEPISDSMTICRQVRDELQRQSSAPGSAARTPLWTYALGVLSHKLGDRETAGSYFRDAKNRAHERYILDGIGRYGI